MSANDNVFSTSMQEIAVYVMPLEGEISSAQMYILRRGLKEAVENEIDIILLKINTPGGDLESTLQIMEYLDNFKGTIMSYVNTEAISAGAYIAASTDDIFFNPKGILGAAAVIQAGGTEISPTLKQKIDSYLRAKIRAYNKPEYRYRADVIRAMMDVDYVFKIEDTIIKDKGELLTLTAQEAITSYGNPPQPLLATAIADSIENLLKIKFPDKTYRIKNFELTWSEYLARWMNKITPILIGLGLLCLFIEFKTPGFTFFGLLGILFLFIVFISSYIAGLAGHEGMIIFIVGLLLLGIEIFILPGVLIAGIVGVLLILGSIIWSLTDIWPGKNFEITPSLFIQPLLDLSVGLIIATVGIILVGRFFLRSWLSSHLILHTSVQDKNKDVKIEEIEIGDKGIAVTDLHPWGEIEIKGNRYGARSRIEGIDKNANIEVMGKENFGLIVKKAEK